jgi:hypothetical protein
MNPRHASESGVLIVLSVFEYNSKDVRSAPACFTLRQCYDFGPGALEDVVNQPRMVSVDPGLKPNPQRWHPASQSPERCTDACIWMSLSVVDARSLTWQDLTGQRDQGSPTGWASISCLAVCF